MKRTTTEYFDEAGRLVERVVVEEDFGVVPLIPTVIGNTPPWSNTWYISDHSANCPCNPANGGLGVCNCTLSGPQVTCSVLNRWG